MRLTTHLDFGSSCDDESNVQGGLQLCRACVCCAVSFREVLGSEA